MMLLLAQNSDGVLHEAWGIVFVIGALATLMSLVRFLLARQRRTGLATIGYSVMTIGVAMLAFFNMPVLGTIVALVGCALALYWYCTTRSGPVDPWS